MWEGESKRHVKVGYDSFEVRQKIPTCQMLHGSRFAVGSLIRNQVSLSTRIFQNSHYDAFKKIVILEFSVAFERRRLPTVMM